MIYRLQYRVNNIDFEIIENQRRAVNLRENGVKKMFEINKKRN